MRILCVFGQHNYGNPLRGEGYEYANFIPTLRRLGHEVLFFESWNRSLYSGFLELNVSLLRMVEDTRPDIIFSVLMNYEIWLETWDILRDAGISATVNWTTDDSWKYPQFSRFLAPSFHAYTTTYPAIYERYQRDGISNVLLTQWAASPVNLQPPLAARQCKYPISFIGTAHSDRRIWIDGLCRRGIVVTCFGHGWTNGPIPYENIPEIIQKSVISLNFSMGARTWNGIFPRKNNQIKARTFEIPGAGGFLLTEWTADIERYFTPGVELETFKNLGELADKIHYYLAHYNDRDMIAQAGYQRVRRDHTYDKRLTEVLNFALWQRDKYFSCPIVPLNGKIDWVKFGEAARLHQLNRKLQLFRNALIEACSLVWGSVRGPQAARRLVYELSWRLSGPRTYSASGWPGRLFYKES